jgi:hypothetical protein
MLIRNAPPSPVPANVELKIEFSINILPQFDRTPNQKSKYNKLIN